MGALRRVGLRRPHGVELDRPEAVLVARRLEHNPVVAHDQARDTRRLIAPPRDVHLHLGLGRLRVEVCLQCLLATGEPPILPDPLEQVRGLVRLRGEEQLIDIALAVGDADHAGIHRQLLLKPVGLVEAVQPLAGLLVVQVPVVGPEPAQAVVLGVTSRGPLGYAEMVPGACCPTARSSVSMPGHRTPRQASVFSGEVSRRQRTASSRISSRSLLMPVSSGSPLLPRPLPLL